MKGYKNTKRLQYTPNNELNRRKMLNGIMTTIVLCLPRTLLKQSLASSKLTII